MQKNTGVVSRKSFLKGAGAAALLGMSSIPAFADEVPALEWTAEADVVVVGLGGAGDAAAVSALDAGASVIVLEKTSAGGGSTRICGGLVYMGGGTPLQKQWGIEDTVEDMKAYITAAAGPSADPELVDVFCANSLDLYDWLIEKGVTFDGGYEPGHVVTAPEGIALTYSGNERSIQYTPFAAPAPRGHTPNGGGAAICDALENQIASEATIMYETPATELVTDGNGTVIGVKAVNAEGKEVLVKANKGVVLAAGAFTFNDEMLADYAAQSLLVGGKTGVPADSGDGILMGMKVGAATKSMSKTNIANFIYQHGDLSAGVLVNWNGVRFMSEDWYGSWTGRYIAELTPESVNIIVDSDILAKIKDAGLDWNLEPAAQADTIEDLAEQLGLDPAVLSQTIAHYNELCDGGIDLDWGKSEEYLSGIRTAPFYAIDFSNGIRGWVHTCGGLKINANSEVLNLDGDPIPGLYAAGRTSCGVYGEYFGSGSSVGDCLTFGRIAGAQAAAR